MTSRPQAEDGAPAPSGPLRPGRRALLELSAALASGDDDVVEAALAAAGAVAGPEELEEALLQSYLFLGFPVALAAVSRWRAQTGGLPVETDSLAQAERVSDWTRRGEEVCRVVYGDKYENLRRNVRQAHPALDRWMVTEGYGKVLGRPGLDLATRELCIVAILAAAGWEPQLHSHLQGALHAGAEPAAVEEALLVGLARSRGGEWPGRAEALWRRVRDRVDLGGAHPRAPSAD